MGSGRGGGVGTKKVGEVTVLYMRYLARTILNVRLKRKTSSMMQAESSSAGNRHQKMFIVNSRCWNDGRWKVWSKLV